MPAPEVSVFREENFYFLKLKKKNVLTFSCNTLFAYKIHPGTNELFFITAETSSKEECVLLRTEEKEFKPFCPL